ncbi:MULTISPECIES: hypothetical protein [Streptomyces]|uniref:hypothetical protein n=1 Tax=Streptomyces TaxID=1883 RepID=UPI0032B728A6
MPRGAAVRFALGGAGGGDGECDYSHGWDWLARLAAQDLPFARGSYTPRDAVTSGQKAIGVGGSGAPLASGPVKWVPPDGATPFMSWGSGPRS